MCKIGEVVVVGGVRRSAMISLSDLDDERIRHAKSGPWWETAPHRALANNSAVYGETPTVGKFMEEWLSLYNSHSGERGIFNREAAKKTVAKYGHRGLAASEKDDWVQYIDPTIPKDEPGHPIQHLFTNRIPTSQCMVCHIHPGTTGQHKAETP
jgi:hypothetical protein